MFETLTSQLLGMVVHLRNFSLDKIVYRKRRINVNKNMMIATVRVTSNLGMECDPLRHFIFVF